MRIRYDLNADVGEGFGYDDELLTVVSSANVACGFHAGDATTMRRMCRIAVARGVAIGAQVSYRDREGFGRRDVEVCHRELVADLSEQVEALLLAAADEGGSVGYLKPHGALYNRAATDPAHARAVVEVCGAFALPVLGLPDSVLLEQTRQAGLRGWREFFADRSYDAVGRLVARQVDGALISDPVVVTERIRHLVERGTVTTVDGVEIDVSADSICVHGDSPGAPDLARAVRDTLEADGALVAAVV